MLFCAFTFEIFCSRSAQGVGLLLLQQLPGFQDPQLCRSCVNGISQQDVCMYVHPSLSVANVRRAIRLTHTSADIRRLEYPMTHLYTCIYPSDKDNQQFENIPNACSGSPLSALRHQYRVGKDQEGRVYGKIQIDRGLSPHVNVHLLSAPSRNTRLYHIGRTACQALALRCPQSTAACLHTPR